MSEIEPFGNGPSRPDPFYKFEKAFHFKEKIIGVNDRIEHGMFVLLLISENFQEIFDTIVEDRSSESMLTVEVVCDYCTSGFLQAMKFGEFKQKMVLFKKFHNEENGNYDYPPIFAGCICDDCLLEEKDESCVGEDYQWAVPGNNLGKINTKMFWQLIESCDEYQGWEQRLSQRLLALSYSEFLTTPYWKTVSFFVKSKYRWMCANCSDRNALSVHHKTYKNHGMEHRKWDTDLICLCSDCHQKEHSR